MELMEESLTAFLHKHDQPLPFHTQVNICHDIALALSFLHSNDILHRDLSSNNVLMIGDKRAKVTDFGMARMFSHDRTILLSKHPGTDVYMPPEAGEDGRNYNISIDCFSFGVLVIQILTLLYPSPGKSYVPLKGKKKNLHERVPEVERRQNHIELVEQGHSLLQLALDCIRDDRDSRPSAQEICCKLEEMKESERYMDSVQSCDLARENKELKEAARTTKQQHVEEISSLETARLESFEALGEQNRKELQDLEDSHRQKLEELQVQHAKDVDYLQQVIKSKEEEMKFLQHSHNHNIMELKQSHALHLKSMEDSKDEWKEKYKYAKAEVKRLKKRVEDLEGGEVKSKVVKKSDREMSEGRSRSEGRRSKSGGSGITINWSLRDKPAPQTLYRDDSETVFCNDTLYIRPGSGRSVFAYHPRLDEWKEMPRCPHKHSTLAHINSTVIIIGGRTDALIYLNNIYYLTEEGGECQWKEASFRMPTKRCSPIVVTTGTSLVVAGGEGEESRLRRVEVMDIPTHTWSTAADLPESLLFSSAALCAGSIHFLGGEVGYHGVEKHCMFSCSVDDLLKSLRPISRDRKRRSSEPLVNVWRTTPGPPVVHSACVAFRGQLLSIGGKGRDGKPTSAVYGLNAESWSIVSYMCMTRSMCFAVVLPGDEILHRDEVLVLGGNSASGKTDTLELGTV